jgi:sugar lactone lactonase YvrE
LAIRLARYSVFLSLISLSMFAVAQGTHSWEQSNFEALAKGTAQEVAILSGGGLELAPAFTPLATTPSTYIWSVAADRHGTLYAAAGSPARIYRIAEGKSTVIFAPQELQVQALAVDPQGAIYAATNPDGKIYKLVHGGEATKKAEGNPQSGDSEWSSSVYFDPESKYIWDLALDHAGNLYAATGDQGQIYRITPEGQHSVFFKSEETHIRVLAFDQKGNLIAGSDGSGLVYRISPRGDAFVLYSAPKKEITALAVGTDGNIYVAGAGEKHGGASGSGFSITLPAPPGGGTGPQTGPTAAGGASTALSIALGNPSSGTATGGSEIYRISPDGSPARIWSSRDDLVYALAFDGQGRLLAGTGNHGQIFAVDPTGAFRDLLTAAASQVTAFTPAPQGGLYVATSNLGKVFLVSANSAAEGTYTSDVFDAHIFSRWGRVEMRAAGKVELFARSGNVDNPDRNWSAWKAIDFEKDGLVNAPPARFIQWKALLDSGTPAPRLDSVRLYYLPKNVPPEFDDVTVQLGVRYQSLPKVSATDTSQARFDSSPASTHDRDSVGVKWNVHDDNDDQMVYSVYYRGDGDTRWLLLKDNLVDKFYSFDASLLPDGGYTVKVVASDAPSHSPGQALTAEKESERFEIDTTPPRIENLTAAVEGGQLHVSFRVVDSFSTVKRAEYSIDASDWQFVEPVGEISDSKSEKYDFHASPPIDPGPPGAMITNREEEHVVVVRVYDRYDNLSSAKAVIRGK